MSASGRSRPREAIQVRKMAKSLATMEPRIRRTVPLVNLGREMVIGGLLVTALVLAGGGLWVAGRLRERSLAMEGAPVAVTPAEASEVFWQGPNPAEVAERFTRAGSHAERLKWVRYPDQVGAAMEAFFREGPGATEQLAGTALLASSSGGDLLFENYEVRFKGGESRLLSVSVDPAGAKVDFKSYARHCSESWPDLLSGKVTAAAEMRVILAPGGFYLHRFTDEKKWIHLKASTPDLPEALDFYVPRDSPAARELRQAGGNLSRATVAIRAVGDSAKYRQFEITGVTATDWVEPDR